MVQNVGPRVGALLTKGAMTECGGGFLGKEVGRKCGAGGYLVGGSVLTKGAIVGGCGAGFLDKEVGRKSGKGVSLVGATIGFLYMVEGFGDVVRDEVDWISVELP